MDDVNNVQPGDIMKDIHPGDKMKDIHPGERMKRRQETCDSPQAVRPLCLDPPMGNTGRTAVHFLATFLTGERCWRRRSPSPPRSWSTASPSPHASSAAPSLPGWWRTRPRRKTNIVASEELAAKNSPRFHLEEDCEGSPRSGNCPPSIC